MTVTIPNDSLLYQHTGMKNPNIRFVDCKQYSDWCKENCEDGFASISPGKWQFDSETDGIMFQLRWI